MAGERSGRSPSEACFQRARLDDYLYWQANDLKLLARLNGLIKECARTPFSGTGKPEPLAGAAVRLVVSAADARTPSCLQAIG